MPETQFDQLNIVSDDLEATVRFYRGLGMKLRDPVRTPAGEPFHANSEAGSGALLEADSSAFARIWNAGWKAEADLNGRVVIGLRVASREDVDRLYGEVVSAGHRGLQPPFDAFWGARYAIVEDPNGVAVGLMSPADDGHRLPPELP
jgi:catechol 2,3-dioxygenase-like lactoylglutathione lyase family enzyme